MACRARVSTFTNVHGNLRAPVSAPLRPPHPYCRPLCRVSHQYSADQVLHAIAAVGEEAQEGQLVRRRNQLRAFDTEHDVPRGIMPPAQLTAGTIPTRDPVAFLESQLLCTSGPHQSHNRPAAYRPRPAAARQPASGALPPDPGAITGACAPELPVRWERKVSLQHPDEHRMQLLVGA